MNKKLIESIAKLAKVSDVEALTKALQSESDTDFKLDTDNLVIRTKEEDSQYKNNIIEDAKPSIWKEATEIQIKNMKKEIGLDFEGKKPEDFISNFKSKVLEEAEVEPNQKINELNTSLETLRTQLKAKDSKFSELQQSIETDKRKFKAQTLIPELSNGLNKDEATALYFMSHEVKEDGIYVNGEKQKDKMEKALSFEESVSKFVESKGWNAPPKPTGRGGGAGSEGASSDLPTTIEEYDEYIKEKGYNPGSQEANAVLNDMVKADKD